MSVLEYKLLRRLVDDNSAEVIDMMDGILGQVRHWETKKCIESIRGGKYEQKMMRLKFGH